MRALFVEVQGGLAIWLFVSAELQREFLLWLSLTAEL